MVSPAERNPQGFKVGDAVEVIDNEHAQAGKRGVIKELQGVYTDLFSPRALIMLTNDAERNGPNSAGWIIIVSLKYLKRI